MGDAEGPRETRVSAPRLQKAGCLSADGMLAGGVGLAGEGVCTERTRDFAGQLGGEGRPWEVTAADATPGVTGT